MILRFLTLFFLSIPLFGAVPGEPGALCKILQLVRGCVEHQAGIPAKEEILKVLEKVEKTGSCVESGSDELRVKYVTAQGCIEHVLACLQATGEIHDLKGMIHTPTPATPLCTKPDPIDTALLDSSIRNDPAKLYTVRSRAQIVREYLHKGGILYIVYPRGGLEKRTIEQQAIYRDEMRKFPGKLFEKVLFTDVMDPEMVGGLYFFRDRDNKLFAFSIKSKQANDPKEASEWGIWLAPVSDPALKQRVEALFSYLKRQGGPTIEFFGL